MSSAKTAKESHEGANVRQWRRAMNEEVKMRSDRSHGDQTEDAELRGRSTRGLIIDVKQKSDRG